MARSLNAAYIEGKRDFYAGVQSDDCPFESDAEADAWERGFWDAESDFVPSIESEAILDRRYGGASAWSLG